MAKQKNTTAENAGAAAKGGADSPAAPATSADDLTAISGIGPATAEKLAKAGVATFAQLATLDEATQAELDGVIDMPGGSDWPAWTEAAKKLSGTQETTPHAGGASPADGEENAGGPPVSGSSSRAKGGPGEGVASPDPAQVFGTPGEVVVVTARVPRRRRAGRTFGKQETRIPAPELSAADLMAIEADPQLVLRIETEAAADADATG